MRIFPSIPAAVVLGAVSMPLNKAGDHIFKASSLLSPLDLLVFILTLGAPMLLATFDFPYAKRRGWIMSIREITRDDWKFLFVPSWIRIGVFFFSGIISIFIFKSLGFEL